jgi:hypothetical protein
MDSEHVLLGPTGRRLTWSNGTTLPFAGELRAHRKVTGKGRETVIKVNPAQDPLPWSILC